MPEKNNPIDGERLLETYRIFHLLRQAADAIHRAREIELKKYNLSPEQAGALVCIRSLGNTATPAELSRWLFRERNTITILLKRMYKLGLIKKRADTRRKNIIRLSLTKKGYEAYEHAVEFEAFKTVIDTLPERKRKQLWSLLELVRVKLFKDMRLNLAAYSGCFDKAVILEPDGSRGRAAGRQKTSKVLAK